MGALCRGRHRLVRRRAGRGHLRRNTLEDTLRLAVASDNCVNHLEANALVRSEGHLPGLHKPERFRFHPCRRPRIVDFLLNRVRQANAEPVLPMKPKHLRRGLVLGMIFRVERGRIEQAIRDPRVHGHPRESTAPRGARGRAGFALTVPSRPETGSPPSPRGSWRTQRALDGVELPSSLPQVSALPQRRGCASGAGHRNHDAGPGRIRMRRLRQDVRAAPVIRCICPGFLLAAR